VVVNLLAKKHVKLCRVVTICSARDSILLRVYNKTNTCSTLNLIRFPFPSPATPHCKESDKRNKNQTIPNDQASCLLKPKAFIVYRHSDRSALAHACMAGCFRPAAHHLGNPKPSLGLAEGIVCHRKCGSRPWGRRPCGWHRWRHPLFLPPILPLPLSTSGFSCPGLLSWKDVNGRNTS
jgi:hypothetical protein